MILIIQNPGIKIGKSSELITIKQGCKQKEVAIRKIESVLVMSNAQISYEALLLLSQHGIPVYYMKHGNTIGVFSSFSYHSFVSTRRAQFAAYYSEVGLNLIRNVVKGALQNKSRFLKYLSRNRKDKCPEKAKEIYESARKINEIEAEIEKILIHRQIGNINQRNITDSQLLFSTNPIMKYREKLMGLEGKSARVYFHCLSKILPEKLNFLGRNRRPSKDPVNSALNFGYSLLANEIMIVIGTSGLDPYAGFLHSDRSGRPSLVFDLIEEFRQPIVDRLVIRLFQKKILQNNDFKNEGVYKGVRFKKRPLERFLGEFYYMMRKDGAIINKCFWTYQQIILMQARKMVRYFLGKEDEYRPFLHFS